MAGKTVFKMILLLAAVLVCILALLGTFSFEQAVLGWLALIAASKVVELF